MRRYTILLLCALLVAGYSCHRKTQNPGDSGKSVEMSAMLSEYHHADSLYHLGIIDTGAFNRFIRSAMSFAEQDSQKEVAADMLYKAGIGSMILAKSAVTRDETARYAKQALKIFYDFQEKYPEHENAKYCYYQRGIIYDDILGDYTSAQDQYRDFVNRYPNDSLAVQLSDYLKILGKDERQLEEMLDLK
ncbi:MAG: tetratricopeptide repeat protein [Bacteroidales bacterium]|nr:tetratricopeptide repeat protein [Bacteroidales bacterium]